MQKNDVIEAINLIMDNILSNCGDNKITLHNDKIMDFDEIILYLNKNLK